MKSGSTWRVTLVMVALFVVFTLFNSLAQEQKASGEKPGYLTASQRLSMAKTAYVKNAGGSSIPFDVIEQALQGWPRFTIVDSPEKADLLVEITSPQDDKTSTMASSTIDSTGVPRQSSTTSHEIGSDRVQMVVRDSKSHVVLWSGSAKAKSAMKKRSYNDNLVEAAEQLMTQFHDRVEPQQVAK